MNTKYPWKWDWSRVHSFVCDIHGWVLLCILTDSDEVFSYARKEGSYGLALRTQNTGNIVIFLGKVHREKPIPLKQEWHPKVKTKFRNYTKKKDPTESRTAKSWKLNFENRCSSFKSTRNRCCLTYLTGTENPIIAHAQYRMYEDSQGLPFLTLHRFYWDCSQTIQVNFTTRSYTQQFIKYLDKSLT